MAFDFGAKRVGVAVGDTAIGIAHALDTIAFEDNRRRFDAIAALIEEWRPVRLVVGSPSGDEAREHALAPAVRRFSRRLQARFGLPVDLVDEHLSSWSASRRMTEAGINAREQKPRLDAMAASVILESWFECERARLAAPSQGQ